MHMALYNSLLWAGAPLLDHHLGKRLKSGKEDVSRFGERLGTPSHSRPKGQLIWIHAASVGEAVSALSLIEALLANELERHILVTTGTRTSAEIMQTRLPDRAFHQFVPIDRKPGVEGFLDYWQPDLAIWMESELWPNLICETSSRDIPMLLLNARITEKSYKMWGRSLGFSKRLLGTFDYCSAQSELSAKRLSDLGARNVETLGNLKFASKPLPFDSALLDQLSISLIKRQVWLAASTHPGEDEVVVEAHEQLKKEAPDILTIIVPRHPERGSDIAAMAEQKQLKTALRSKGKFPAEETDIYIADTIGELGLFYRLVGIAFVGGSLVDKGGQNPLEAAHLGCAILQGPHMENFLEVAAEMEQEKATIKVRNAEDLSGEVSAFLADDKLRAQAADNAAGVISTGAAILDSTVAKVEEILAKGAA
ncbi:MAG: 3-deoxy-D-manno-octulosonic acid transferase [Proteobacteria bacterium]|nr:3-deoxy-D-manno-octulosonic acid transferase [Pseudomonadota bacterium]